jgi:CheY-like chemotaxis protein
MNMERILLLEDQPLTRKSLQRLLSIRFPGTTVMTAENDSEASEILGRYRQEGIGLDAVVLDLKVPHSKGTNAEVSRICVDVQRLFPNALIGHITAHYSDDDVGKHLTNYHLGTGQKTDFFIDKRDERWEDSLVSKLAGAGIEHQMEALDDLSTPAARSLRQASQRHQNATFRRAKLVRDIKMYWNLLDSQLKERIRRYFEVDDQHDPVIVR